MITLLQQAEEKMSAISEAVAGLQVTENSDLKVSYPVKDRFNIEN